MSAGSTAFYTFLYAVYYFHYKTRMSGVLQTAFYFGYTSMFCLSLFVLCGSIGYFGAQQFVHRIYKNIKSD
jgi:transmembrane 9 superfamily protein 3